MSRLEISGRIFALRSQLKKTQKEFAELVGVTQPAISDWESESGQSFPSPESYTQLGNVAPYPENLWFWEQAGFSRDAMLSAAVSVLKERGTEPPKGRTVAVPRLQKIGQRFDITGETITVDARFVLNPESVAYWTVDGPAYGPIQPEGTTIFLDRSEIDRPDLEPFFDAKVLIESTGQGKPGDPRLDAGLHAGILRLAGKQGAEHGVWYAILERLEQRGVLWPPDHLGHPENAVGRWVAQMATDAWKLKKETQHGRTFDAKLVRARVGEELRLFPGHSILGRVLWWQPPQAGEK